MFVASIWQRRKLLSPHERIFFHARRLGTIEHTSSVRQLFRLYPCPPVRYRVPYERHRNEETFEQFVAVGFEAYAHNSTKGHLMCARLTSKVWPIFRNRCCKSTFSHFVGFRVAGGGATHNTLTLFKYSKGNNEPYAKGLNVDLHSAIGGRWSAIAKSDTHS